MSKTDDVSPLELAALMCSRVCHDVISPVGAIINGLEVLEDDDDPEMRAHAMELITKSATQASAKLQFARLAFGAAGSAAAELDLQDARKVAEGLMASEKASLLWNAPVATIGKDYVKLLLNMILIGMAAIPRGGEVAVLVEGELSNPLIRVTSAGQAARIPEETAKFLNGRDPDRFLDARAAQPHFTGLVATSLGLKINARMEGEMFIIEAKAEAPAPTPLEQSQGSNA
ncbi:MAG: histidine phosphotransferase [Rhizobiales bacterium]|nr:histidine phosphotransferase [Hyphomicrobiales bacterium]